LLEVGREEMAALDATDAKLKVLRKTS